MARKSLEHRPTVSFVIPTLNRPSLQRTLESLDNQTVADWEAIIVPDPEVEGPNSYSDERIRVVQASKRHSGSAGELRNVGMSLAMGEWVAFVDDDDHLAPEYIEHLAEHRVDHPRAEVIIFRMDDPKLGILPPLDFPLLRPSMVGISFAIRTRTAWHYRFIREDVKQRRHEDWTMIEALKKGGVNIFVSPHIDYFVKEFS